MDVCLRFGRFMYDPALLLGQHLHLVERVLIPLTMDCQEDSQLSVETLRTLWLRVFVSEHEVSEVGWRDHGETAINDDLLIGTESQPLPTFF